MVSEFERQRLLNISRNKELFKKLNLDSISTNFKNEISKDLTYSNVADDDNNDDNSKRSSKRAKTTARRVKVKNELNSKDVMPLRRSNRIAGVKIENPVGVDGLEGDNSRNRKSGSDYFRSDLDEIDRLQRLKRMRLSGDISLMDILNPGQLKPASTTTDNNSNSNSRVNSPQSSPRKRRTRNSSVEDDDQIAVKTEEGDVETPTDTPLSSEEILKLQEISKLGKSLSMGDFYEIIKKNKNLNNKSNNDNSKIDDLRNELDELKLYSKTNPNNINLTNARMTYILFHPSNTKKIIIGGDRDGETGIWSVDDTIENEDDDDDGLGYNDNDPVITKIKTHGTNIPKFEIRENKLEEIMSCSYDGSIRALDLNKLISKSVLEFDDKYGNVSGISDFQFINDNILYFTTLNGEFGNLDIREKNNGRRRLNILRLHDKKIGSFAINPKFDKQIVTASLDRTMRVWDIRKTQKSNWSIKYSDEISPNCIGSYSSRLSVSTADWNNSGDIVCNGYDDTINIFNLSKFKLESQRSTYQFPIANGSVKKDHDDQQEDDDQDEQEQIYNKLIPDNLEPDSKIRHNCQTGRWVSILKAKWQKNPNDGIEKFIIGNMKRFFDIYDRNGNLLGHLNDSLMTSVPAVCNFHPTENWFVGGNASGKAFLFHNE